MRAERALLYCVVFTLILIIAIVDGQREPQGITIRSFKTMELLLECWGNGDGSVRFWAANIRCDVTYTYINISANKLNETVPWCLLYVSTPVMLFKQYVNMIQLIEASKWLVQGDNEMRRNARLAQKRDQWRPVLTKSSFIIVARTEYFGFNKNRTGSIDIAMISRYTENGLYCFVLIQS